MRLSGKSCFGRRCRLATFAAAISLISGSIAAQAEVRVTGREDLVRVAATGARVNDVLAALATSFDLRYRSSITLDGAVTGAYAGTLEQVISRVLIGYNYVLKRSRGSIEVIVIGRQGESTAPRTSPSQKIRDRNSATGWRVSSGDHPPVGQR